MRATELLAWRNQAGLTQPALAALLSVHPMTISKWERGIVAIPPYLKLALNWIKQTLATEHGCRAEPHCLCGENAWYHRDTTDDGMSGAAECGMIDCNCTKYRRCAMQTPESTVASTESAQ